MSEELEKQLQLQEEKRRKAEYHRNFPSESEVRKQLDELKDDGKSYPLTFYPITLMDSKKLESLVSEMLSIMEDFKSVSMENFKSVSNLSEKQNVESVERFKVVFEDLSGQFQQILDLLLKLGKNADLEQQILTKLNAYLSSI